MVGGGLSDSGRPAEDVHPAMKHFAQHLNELTTQWRVERINGVGRPLKLTPKGVHDLLREQAPKVAPSQTQVYRYYSGEAAPSLLQIHELARLFNVSPQSFLLDNAGISAVHRRLRPT